MERVAYYVLRVGDAINMLMGGGNICGGTLALMKVMVCGRGRLEGGGPMKLFFIKGGIER